MFMSTRGLKSPEYSAQTRKKLNVNVPAAIFYSDVNTQITGKPLNILDNGWFFN